MYQSLTLSAGVGIEFIEEADFFRVMKAVPTDLEIIFYAQGREIAKATGIEAGYAERTSVRFDKVRITSATGGLLEFVMRLGSDVRYDKAPTGTVTITGNQGSFAQYPTTVTSTTGEIVAPKADRRYLLIQNNDATGIVYINLAGANATAANGVRLLPGESYENSGFLSTNSVKAIGSIASNPNVVVVQG